jgi:ferredoxin
MTAERVPAKRKNAPHPVVDTGRCLGCGVCADACKKDAMHMVRRADQPYVPETGMERVLRMAIERGHLAQLLFDEGAGRGSRFLSQAFRTLTRLPGAQRVLASEQVTSRFLRAALGKADKGFQ